MSTSPNLLYLRYEIHPFQPSTTSRRMRESEPFAPIPLPGISFFPFGHNLIPVGWFYQNHFLQNLEMTNDYLGGCPRHFFPYHSLPHLPDSATISPRMRPLRHLNCQNGPSPCACRGVDDPFLPQRSTQTFPPQRWQ